MELSKQQRRAVRKLRRNQGGAVWFRVGEGKTRITYAWFATIAKRCERLGITPLFVVVCRRKAFYDWKQEAVKLGLKWRVCDFEIFLGRLSSRPTVFLVSHGMLHKVEPELRDYTGLVQAAALDEGFLYKTPQTLHCKAANKLASRVGRACILSGSVMTARNLEDIYGQFYAINKHEDVNLGRTLTEFRSRFMFKLHINPKQPHQFKFVNAARAVKQVAGLVRPLASIYLPRSPRTIRNSTCRVDGHARQLKAFDMLRNEYWYHNKKVTLELKNKPSVIIKAQQVSDGFMHLGKDPQTKLDRGTIYFPSEKLGYLIDKVAELIACGERCIVWTAFNESVDIILHQLQKEFPKTKHRFYGFTGNRRFDQAGWQRNGLVAVATTDCGSSVNHFAQVQHAIYYSMSFKWLSLQQSQGRIDRKDSRHSVCYYYYLYTKQSLDEFVHQTAIASGKAEKDFIDYTQVNLWLAKQEPSPSGLGKISRGTITTLKHGARSTTCR